MRPIAKRQRSRGQWRKRLAVWAVGGAALVAVLAFAAIGQPTLDRLHNIVFDGYQRLLPRQETGAPLAVVDIDEKSIAKLGQWPWPRTTIARLVDRLGRAGASVIAFDIAFPEADRTSPALALASLKTQGVKVEVPSGLVLDNDAVLGQAFARNPVVAGIAISD
ncbi:MAG: CHASE2 domain-containing protein [Devosia sp.]